MKKIVLILSCLFAASASYSQILFTEDFNYTSQGAGADTLINPAIGGGTWTRHSGGSGIIRDVKFLSTGLNYTGYSASAVGGAAGFQHTVGSEDVNASIGIADSIGSMYVSFMLKIDSSAGRDTATDYFFHFGDGAGLSIPNIRQRLFACNGSTDTTYRLGISKGTSAKLTATNITNGAKAPQFTSTDYKNGKTYLVIMKYTFSGTSGDKKDTMKLFVLSSGFPATEPIADITLVDTGISDLRKIQSICIRQGSIGRTSGTIDGIRVFKTWDAATVALLPTKLTSFTAVGLRDAVNVNWGALCNSSTCKFYVERSIDGVTFELINTLNGKIAVNNYAITDKILPKSNTLYYRIKTINQDGKFDYSNIQKVKLNDVKLIVSPNPAFNQVIVNANANINSVELFDMNGKIFYSNFENNSNAIKINLSKIVAGIYIIKTNVSGDIATQKIFVKH